MNLTMYFAELHKTLKWSVAWALVFVFINAAAAVTSVALLVLELLRRGRVA